MKRLLIAAALATPAIGGIAVTAHAIIGQAGPLGADTNKDGAVSRSEFFTAAQTRFTRRDANSDRTLSGAEIETGRGGKKLLREDGNKDGTISFAEASAATNAQFQAQDDNGDGKLTGEELRPRGPGGRVRGEMGGMLRQADTNQDGKISRDELRASTDRMFDRLDANHDGVVDQSEMSAMRGAGRGPNGNPGRYPGGIGAAGDVIPPPPPLPHGQ